MKTTTTKRKAIADAVELLTGFFIFCAVQNEDFVSY